MTATPPGNALYVGDVTHERKAPRTNRFRYGVYFLHVDIDQLAELDARLKVFSFERPNLFALRLADHGPRDGSPWRPWIESTLKRANVDLDGGTVQLLTFPRVLGFHFFPVAFWYCYHSDGSLRAILAEVNNTFGDHHNYLLHNDGDVLDSSMTPEHVKAFHVSPFIPLDARYRFRFTEPGERVALAIDDYVEGPLLLIAGVSLTARPLTDGQLLRCLVRYGPMSARAWLLIHFQAIRIVAKRIRYIPRTPPPTEETSW